MAEQIWDSFARLNAGERFKEQSAEMGAAVTEAMVEAAEVHSGGRGCGCWTWRAARASLRSRWQRC